MSMEVERRLFEAMNEAEGYLEMARQTLESRESQTDELTNLRVQLEDTLSTSLALRERIDTLSKRNKALKNQMSRAQGCDHGVQPATTPTGDKGVIPDATRSLIRDLISFGLKVHQVREVIEAVADVTGTVVEGHISERSIRRVTLEGLVASELQVAIESMNAEGITISSDGTTHKNINYDSHHLHFNTGSSHERGTLGIQSSHNHTSESQLASWKSRIQSVLDTYNASPLGDDGPLDTKTFLQKKRQADREVRGKRVIAELAPLDLLPILAEEVAAAMDHVGGTEAWSMLTDKELDGANLEIRRSVITRLGEELYAALPDGEKQLADMFVHAGCCMHKELNAVKGGSSRMAQSWSKFGLQPPMLLMNRDNDAAATSGPSAAAKRAAEKSVGGAVKLADLAGALFRHKDDKKGQQDATRYHFEATLGVRFTFPDTSNTRYQSYCEAAGELLVHLQLYRDFLELVRDKKTTGMFNHMERNVHKGLHDIPTLTELCVLALYRQSVCHPYMREVRGPQDGLTNHLDLGPLHEWLKAYMARIIADPDILLAPEAMYATASLDGKPWERPAVLVSVLELASTLPHLRSALVEFFAGALETWERFTAEFAPGGTIASLSKKHRELAMSLHQHNAHVMYKLNGTSEFFFRQRAREIDGSGIEHKHRIDKQKSERQAKESRKLARRAKLAKVEPILDLALLTMARKNDEIQDQLAWHREFIDVGPRAEKKMPMAKLLTSKALRLAALVDAVKRYNAAPPVDQPWLNVEFPAAETVLDDNNNEQ
ncbi:hypothetical protein GY45DRAFT_1349231 [Cubamyces sp. BRFM 1775]|nr:hypothetical protein GY45DRAFT_1349231 [Cubamyces sp. BRFM 1775]